jgi:hypothetical protein
MRWARSPSLLHMYVCFLCDDARRCGVWSKGLIAGLTGCDVLFRLSPRLSCADSRGRTRLGLSSRVRRVASEVEKAYLVWCAEVETHY